jgi:putative restriction endonuclease
MWIQGPNDWSFNLPSGKYYDTPQYDFQQCAVTKEHSIPALEAAHIKPYSLGGFHEVNNGLLLRADIHKLFDKGYVTITPDYYFKVSEHLQTEYHNGKIYYEINKI